MKTVLAAAARLRLIFPNWSETEIVVQALRDVNQPKFVGDDIEEFDEIIHDFFPNLPSCQKSTNDTLKDIISQVALILF